MVIEVLYKEFYIYGEKGNVDYLELMFKDAQFIHTKYNETPYFVNNRPDMIIIEPMAEFNLDRVAKKLEPHKQRLIELIEEDVYFFAFNNVLDILGTELKIKGEKDGFTLGIFNYHSIRDYDNRYAKLIYTKIDSHYVLASKMGFSNYYGNKHCYIYKTLKGGGFNNKSDLGGFRYKNSFLIEALGNIFMYNPYLSKKLLDTFGFDTKLPFEQDVFESYNKKISEWKRDGIIKQAE